MIENPETLEEYIDKIISHAKIISAMMDEVNAQYGVDFLSAYIRPMDMPSSVSVRRGLEMIEKAMGKNAKQENADTYSLRRMNYRNVQFSQYADVSAMTFTKAGEEPPMIEIVEDVDDGM